MALKVLRFASLFPVTLIFGLAFCHVMEVPGKLRLNGTDWLAVRRHFYVALGAPIGASIEVLSILSAWALALAVRRRRPTFFYWTIIGAPCVTGGLAAWFALVAPMNAVLGARIPEALPAGWAAVRDHWERGHAVYAALLGLGFGTLVIASLFETPNEPRW
jgi:hypothetical protein